MDRKKCIETLTYPTQTRSCLRGVKGDVCGGRRYIQLWRIIILLWYTSTICKFHINVLKVLRSIQWPKRMSIIFFLIRKTSSLIMNQLQRIRGWVILSQKGKKQNHPTTNKITLVWYTNDQLHPSNCLQLKHYESILFFIMISCFL